MKGLSLYKNDCPVFIGHSMHTDTHLGIGLYEISLNDLSMSPFIVIVQVLFSMPYSCDFMSVGSMSYLEGTPFVRDIAEQQK